MKIRHIAMVGFLVVVLVAGFGAWLLSGLLPRHIPTFHVNSWSELPRIHAELGGWEMIETARVSGVEYHRFSKYFLKVPVSAAKLTAFVDSSPQVHVYTEDNHGIPDDLDSAIESLGLDEDQAMVFESSRTWLVQGFVDDRVLIIAVYDPDSEQALVCVQVSHDPQ